jgi:hypothetical protein
MCLINRTKINTAEQTPIIFKPLDRQNTSHKTVSNTFYFILIVITLSAFLYLFDINR